MSKNITKEGLGTAYKSAATDLGFKMPKIDWSSFEVTSGFTWEDTENGALNIKVPSKTGNDSFSCPFGKIKVAEQAAKLVVVIIKDDNTLTVNNDNILIKSDGKNIMFKKAA